MATSVTASPRSVPAIPVARRRRRMRLPERFDSTRRRQIALLLAFAAVNAVIFLLVSPDVNDLWAARARASAVRDGVGLTYWFSWFGGGSTPGNYSVVTPYLSAYLGTELVGAVSALAVCALAAVALRATPRPVAGTAVAVLAAGVNLWSGRVPFLLGAAIAVGAVIAVQRRDRRLAVLLTLLSMLASPVSGAFLVIGLSGLFLTTRTRAWRPIIGWVAVAAGMAAIVVTLVFGAPGPEPFSLVLALQLLGALVLLFLAAPPDHVRTTIMVCAPVIIALFAIPNGMGSNFARFVWFCLPVVVVATATRRGRWVALLMVPVLALGASGTVTDLRNAAKPVSSPNYYTALAQQLDRISGLRNYRLEVVDHGAHTGYTALLGHALLARGWETQEDQSFNKALEQSPLPPTTYKVWLDNNAVGYVALPAQTVGGYPEYDLVHSGRAGFLHRIWSNSAWQLFQVVHPTPIAERPALVVHVTQSAMRVRVPCACQITIRVHWSKFLQATLLDPDEPSEPTAGSGSAGSAPPVRGVVTDDGSSWTLLRTPRAGVYVLNGSLDVPAR